MSRNPPPVIVGGADVAPDDLRWARKAEDLEFDALANVRSAAEKWSASLAAILALFGTVVIVKGHESIADLGSDGRIAIGAVVLLALAAAVTATTLTAYAAQGTPKQLRWPSGPRLRAWEHEAALTAKSRLFWSRVLTIVTVLLLAGAVGISWVAEGEKSDSSATVLLTPERSAPLCGQLTRTDDGALALKAGEDTEPVLIPRGRYGTATVVSGCGE